MRRAFAAQQDCLARVLRTPQLIQAAKYTTALDWEASERVAQDSKRIGSGRGADEDIRTLAQAALLRIGFNHQSLEGSLRRPQTQDGHWRVR